MRRGLLLFGVLTCTALARAGDINLGGEFGARRYDNACDAHAQSCHDHDDAWGAFAGYRWQERWSVELGYIDLGEARATYPRVNGSLEVTGRIDGYDLSALFAIPLGERGRFLLRAGGFRWQATTHSVEFSAEAEGWSLSAGAAMEWRMGQSWQLRCQYLYLDGLGGDDTGRTNGQFASVGLSYLIRWPR